MSVKVRAKTHLRYFVCPVCCEQLTAPKRRGATLPGHVKHMYCYRCKKIRPFIQIDYEGRDCH